MSITTQLQRIMQAKEDIKASLQALGCPIPSSATVDEYSSYIDCIEGQYNEPIEQPLTFVATESGTFKFIGNSINYSLDSGATWTELPSDTSSPTVSAGNKIMWKASLTPFATDDVTSFGIGRFVSSANFTAEGNIMSLLYGDNFSTRRSLYGKKRAFKNLFLSSKITSAENLLLPTMILEEYCYQRMFSSCTSLTTAPNLPATSLSTGCYEQMFNGCTNLSTAPNLPAIALSYDCYGYMFQGCTSLTTAPNLSATLLADYCYYSMFQGCTSLTRVPLQMLPSKNLNSYCYGYMFQGCTSLTTAPNLPATALKNYCYYCMFRNCTSLTTAPNLPATILVTGCYSYMFQNCEKLQYIQAMFTTTPSTSYTNNWVSGVASSGTFAKNSAATWNVTGVNGIPSGWTVRTASS